MVIMPVSDLAVGEWGGGGGEWFVLDLKVVGMVIMSL